MSETLYHVLIANRETGPYPLAQLQEMWRSGKVTAETLYWKQGQAGWEPLAKMASLLGEASPQDLRRLMPTEASSQPAQPKNRIADCLPAAPAETSGLAIASFICGLGGLILGIPALGAVIFGHIARGNIKQSAGTLHGRGLATAGLVLGYLVIGIFAAVSGFIAFVDHHRGTEFQDLHHARQIGAAVLHYASDHQDRTPPDLGTLFPAYISDNKIFVSPLAPDAKSIGYELMLPNTKVSTIKDPAHTVLVQGRNKTAKSFRTYVYADGHTAARREQ